MTTNGVKGKVERKEERVEGVLSALEGRVGGRMEIESQALESPSRPKGDHQLTDAHLALSPTL